MLTPETTNNGTAVEPPPTRRSLPYMRGLDGLRALAVIAVIIYHLELPWLPAGFLGVDVFFVVSGFLITALLLADVRRMGRFDVKDFWVRRFRRLVPALILMLLALIAYMASVHPDEVAGLRGDVVAALGYVTNWALIVTDQSYFEAFSRPPVLRHLWSLAVEEQFYLMWPIVFAAGWTLLRRRMLSLIWLGALASTALMWILYEPLVDPSRIYFGTDTRAIGLLLGVGLAYVASPERLVDSDPSTRIWRELAGWGGLGMLVAWMALASEFDDLLYRGGFLAVGIATMATIVGAGSPTTLAAVLSQRGLVWIGRRSYGIYLWHWPVLMLTRPGLDVPIHGTVLAVAQVTLTILLAAVSYRFVERPIITLGFGGWIRSWAPRWRRIIPATATAACFATIVTLAVAGGVANSPVSPAPPAAAVDSAVTTTMPPTTTTEAVVALPSEGVEEAPASPPGPQPGRRAGIAMPVDRMTGSGDAGEGGAGEGGAGEAGADEPPKSTKTNKSGKKADEPAKAKESKQDPEPKPEPKPNPPLTVTAMGDSVMLGAADALVDKIGDTLTVDAVQSRSFGNGVAEIAAMAKADTLGDILVVHLGTNGPINDELMDELIAATGKKRRVIAVTVRVPRRWEDNVNETLEASLERFSNLELVDWKSVSDSHDEYFVSDGVHLTDDGRQRYAKLLKRSIGDLTT